MAPRKLNDLARHYDGSMRRDWGREYGPFRDSVISQFGEFRNKTILDYGCGTGLLLEYIKEHYPYTGRYLACDVGADCRKHKGCYRQYSAKFSPSAGEFFQLKVRPFRYNNKKRTFFAFSRVVFPPGRRPESGGEFQSSGAGGSMLSHWSTCGSSWQFSSGGARLAAY